ncbi:cytotoxic translational repressor of toxin-antitoxin stability system [Saccharopolyspora sp. 5N708]|uniref:cytotoxic translational repressor of toxin-antitoxin stability system n=1 Tax=Saccharopolyspora sp. 5N708 TaxID=3457424 RepID=UPI003FD14E80
MNWPQLTRKDHDTFWRVEEWRPVRDARGRTGTHDVSYELGLPDGRILRTRISHLADQSNYRRSMWSHILRDQLQVEESVFWACVQDGVKPDRGAPSAPAEALPADLVHLLISRVGIEEAQVAGMSKDEAVARVQRYWTEGS